MQCNVLKSFPVRSCAAFQKRENLCCLFVRSTKICAKNEKISYLTMSWKKSPEMFSSSVYYVCLHACRLGVYVTHQNRYTLVFGEFLGSHCRTFITRRSNQNSTSCSLSTLSLSMQPSASQKRMFKAVWEEIAEINKRHGFVFPLFLLQQSNAKLSTCRYMINLRLHVLSVWIYCKKNRLKTEERSIH